MSGTLVVALIVLGIFAIVLVVLAVTGPSEPDAVTQEVIEQGLTGPVTLPPARTRLAAPNQQPDGDNEKPS